MSTDYFSEKLTAICHLRILIGNIAGQCFPPQMIYLFLNLFLTD